MSKLNEEWRPVVGYEGLYEVSDWGNVRSCDRLIMTKKGNRHYKSKIIAPFLLDTDYLDVNLYEKMVRKHKKVHRLVAEAFIPNPDNKPCIDHINGIRTDNRVENLRWCTHPENNNFDLYKKHKQNNINISKMVYQYTLDGELVNIWPSTMEIERQLHYDNSKISRCCLGKQKTAYGYIWSYEPM